MKSLIGILLVLSSALFAAGQEPQRVDALIRYATNLDHLPEFTLLYLKPDGTYIQICTVAGARSSANPATSGFKGRYTMTSDGSLTTVTFGTGFPTLVFDPVTKIQTAPLGSYNFTVQWFKRDDSAVLGNTSARTYVTPAHPGILGISLTANTSRLVLVRAVGSALSAFSVADTLTDPWLTVYRGNKRHEPYPGDYYPRDPRNSPGQVIATGIVGAFPLNDQSTDCSQLFWLEPGVYTATATSASNSNSGTVLLEAYVLPYSAD